MTLPRGMSYATSPGSVVFIVGPNGSLDGPHKVIEVGHHLAYIEPGVADHCKTFVEQRCLRPCWMPLLNRN